LPGRSRRFPVRRCAGAIAAVPPHDRPQVRRGSRCSAPPRRRLLRSSATAVGAGRQRCIASPGAAA